MTEIRQAHECEVEIQVNVCRQGQPPCTFKRVAMKMVTTCRPEEMREGDEKLARALVVSLAVQVATTALEAAKAESIPIVKEPKLS